MKAPNYIKDLSYSDVLNPGDVIALGDVHATWDLYAEFLQWIFESQTTVILLGDLIDRGGQDLAVLDATVSILDDPERWGLQSFNVLQGNHERMFIGAANGGDYQLWAMNGGNTCDYKKMVRKHLDWMSELPIYMTVGDTLFVHGGLFPGKNPAKTIAAGETEDLVWMRDPFLNLGPMFEKWNPALKRVVHGHTITNFEKRHHGYVPIMTNDRVNIDTGAFLDKGALTAYNVTQGTFHQFKRTKSKTARKWPNK